MIFILGGPPGPTEYEDQAHHRRLTIIEGVIMNPLETRKSRRHFLATVVPACAATCLGFKMALAQDKASAGSEKTAEDVHPFDAELPRKLTYRQLYRNRYRNAIELAKALQEEMGDEKAIEFLKNNTTKNMIAYGKSQAEKTEDHSLHQYTEQFRKVENYKNTLTMKIVEDTDQAFELKVTECMWASTFRDADAGDIGFAMVCHGDYAWAEGFNPKIKMVRDKTLMEGAAICNHRYVWQG